MATAASPGASNIWFFRHRRRRQVRPARRLFGPFGWEQDMATGLLSPRGFDGWLCPPRLHKTRPSAGAAHEISMNSGSTTGCAWIRAEQHTWGQVNPYGLAGTPSAISIPAIASAPTYQLLAGGYYRASARRTTASASPRPDGAQPRLHRDRRDALLQRRPLAASIGTTSLSATS